MSSVVIGTAGANEQPHEFEYDPNYGVVTIRRWKGTDAAIQSLLPQLSASGYRYRYRPGHGGLSEVEARIAVELGPGGVPIPEEPAAVWTLTANAVEKDVLESNISAIATLNSTDAGKAQLAALRKWIDTADESDKPKLSGDALTLFNQIQRGLKSVIVLQPIIRAELLVSNTYQTKASMARVGSVLTAAQMSSLEGVPNDVLFNVSDITTTPVHSDQTAGWYKMHPTITDAPQGKFRISLEYQYGLWSNLVYGIS